MKTAVGSVSIEDKNKRVVEDIEGYDGKGRKGCIKVGDGFSANKFGLERGRDPQWRTTVESVLMEDKNGRVYNEDVRRWMGFESKTYATAMSEEAAPIFNTLKVPVDLVIDHSVQVDVARSENAV
ncbi:hypothetical protein LOK49_LG08G02905 [Camellia lanceoleosa]|uniref:Uncharacterized protein n=1 Tax=Camellia lanceoleosa TaxID=1840588 RepID=A0ACC0GVQ8_9ERIC|nr:hypothetical protein LOK49_LG08G02905 [Camellia lanceoleosa]